MTHIDTSKRTNQTEIMDDFELKGYALEETLQDLDIINKWLGGNQITIHGIQELLGDIPKNQCIKIADIGCGNGTMLRETVNWARKNNRKLQLTGIDANLHAIEIAKKMSVSYPEISYSSANIFSEVYKFEEWDIILCTLTLHHFKNPEILKLLKELCSQAKIGIVINDLQRSRIAYYLFKAFCTVFIKNEIAKKDGLVSILRGFKKKELVALAQELPAPNQQIQWKWAFRYQWLISTNRKNI